MRCLLALLTLLTLPAGAWAQPGERERLAAERQSLVDLYAAEERACHARFIVTACVDELRVRRRAALKPLRERELALDDAERRQRANDRQAARAARPQPASAAAVRPAAPVDPAPARMAAPPSATLGEPGAERAGGATAQRALQAAERARASAQRAEQLDATQAELARRNAERAATGKAAATLPVPAAASAASR